MTADNMITGYQYGDDCSYTGPYTFPDNKDKDAVHLPPHTTLLVPPIDLPAGMEAAFNVKTGRWEIRPEDLSWMDEDSRAKLLVARASAVTEEVASE